MNAEKCVSDPISEQSCVSPGVTVKTLTTEAGGATAPGFNNSQPTIIINNHLD